MSSLGLFWPAFRSVRGAVRKDSYSGKLARRLGYSAEERLLSGVPERHYYGLLSTSSPGWYFNYYLKGRY